MKHCFKLLSAVCALTMCAAAVVSPALALAEPAPDKTQIPRMVTVNFYRDSTTQMAFNWNTTSYTDSDVWVVPLSDGAGFSSSSVIKASGKFQKSLAAASDGYIHSCVVEGLAPSTEYMYRVGDAELGVWSQTGTFKTGSASFGEFSVLHLSDPQGWEASHYKMYNTLLQNAIGTIQPDWVALTGDIVNNSWEGYIPTLQQWEWALTDTFAWLGNLPVMPVAGNHEAADYDFSSRFNLPVPDGSDQKTGSYYSFDYNGVHVVCLNTNDTSNRETAAAKGLSQAQYDWLVDDLQSHQDAVWTIMTMHKGLFDGGSHSNNTDGTDYDIALIREQVAPLCTQYGVDLVLQGHDHLYSRTYPLIAQTGESGYSVEAEAITPAEVEYNGLKYTAFNSPKGTFYMNSGSASASKFYEPVGYDSSLIELCANPGMAMCSSVQVTEQALYIDTYTLDDFGNFTRYNNFAITKSAAGGQDTPQVDSPQNQTQTPKNTPTTLIIGLSVGGGVIVVAAIAAAVTLVIKKRKEKTDD